MYKKAHSPNCMVLVVVTHVQYTFFWGGAPRDVVPLCSLQSTLRSQRVNTERMEH